MSYSLSLINALSFFLVIKDTINLVHGSIHDIVKVPNQITSTKLMLSICNNPRFHEGIPDVLDVSVIAPQDAHAGQLNNE